jgi:hypothetical protein
MKRQVRVTIAALVLLAVTVLPVMAAGGQNQIQWHGGVFALVGEVTALDGVARTITVMVHTGSGQVKDYIGQELTVTTDSDTLFLLYGAVKCKVIAFADVELGDYISVNGHVVDSLFVAKRVTVDVPLHHLQ